MMSTFVDVVGYQLEKVHTGAMKWLLDWDSSEISVRDKKKIIRKLYRASDRPMPFDLSQLNSIQCTPEFSFGRQLRIDLVVALGFQDGGEHYLVMEMKVDSVPREEQLGRIRKSFGSKPDVNRRNADYFLLLIGTSHVCRTPKKMHSFARLALDDIVFVFSGLRVRSHLYDDWVSALRDEQERRDNIARDIKLLPGDHLCKGAEHYWLGKGYRLRIPLFYYIYNHLREQYLDSDRTWDIYSAKNNPVMHWRTKRIGKRRCEFYWEFNGQGFFLKAHITDPERVGRRELNELRARVYPVCQTTEHIGQPTKKTYDPKSENHNYSVYKWPLDFKNMRPGRIAHIVDDDILAIHPALGTLT